MGLFDFFRKSNDNSTDKINNIETIIDDNIDSTKKELDFSNLIPVIVKETNQNFNRPQSRNFLFWESVKNTYKSMCSDITKKFMAQLSNMHLNEETDENALLRLTMYSLEFDRFCAFVFKNWVIHTIPNLTENELKSLDSIANSTLKNMLNPKSVGNMPTEELDKLNLIDYFQKNLFFTANRCADFAEIDINNKYGFYDGKGHDIIDDVEYDNEETRNLVFTFKAMSWMMPDIFYTISKTSKSLPYEKVDKYVKTNHIPSNSENEKDLLQGLRMLRFNVFLGETWLEIIQTVNYIASDEFMK